MLSLYNLKPYFQRALKPLANHLAATGVSPIQISLLALAISCGAGAIMAAFAPWPMIFVLLPIALLVRMILNGIDGLLAHDHNMASDLGQYLNELGGVISDIALYLPLLLIGDISQVLVLFNVLGSTLTEFVGVLGLHIGQARRYEGPMGKSDRAVAFSFVAIVYGFDLLSAGWLNFFLTVIFLAQALTIYNRVNKALAVK